MYLIVSFGISNSTSYSYYTSLNTFIHHRVSFKFQQNKIKWHTSTYTANPNIGPGALKGLSQRNGSSFPNEGFIIVKNKNKNTVVKR